MMVTISVLDQLIQFFEKISISNYDWLLLPVDFNDACAQWWVLL